MVPDPAGTVIHRWRPASVDPEVAAFCRQVVTEAAPHSPARAKAYLFAAGRIGTFARSKGLLLTAEVCLSEAVVERYVATEGARLAPATLRTVRSNLRALRRQVLGGPQPALIGRERARAPYSPAEIARYLALCDAQPTVARRQRATGLVCLGAGAGLVGGDLRCVRGHDVKERSGGVVVEVRGPKPRVVPVLARFHRPLVASARFGGDGFVIGGRSDVRRTVTTPLVASLAGGLDLAPLDTMRLRATWLAEVAASLGLKAFMDAAGIVCSQRLGDLVTSCPSFPEDVAVALLGGAG